MIQVNSFKKNTKKQSFDTVLMEKIWIESILNSVVSCSHSIWYFLSDFFYHVSHEHENFKSGTANAYLLIK